MSIEEASSSSIHFPTDDEQQPSNTISSRNNKPKFSDSKFVQQQLPGTWLVLTPKVTISTFLICTVVLISIGVASLTASRNVVEIVHRYDAECVPKNLTDKEKVAYIQSDANKTCTFQLQVVKKMKAPIYVYYELRNFYQNHRRYMRSRNHEQLRDSSKASSTKNCEPQSHLKGEPIVPCGLVAWSLFNDTFSFTRNNATLVVNKKGISWKSDKDHRFGSDVFPSNFQKGPIIGGAQLDEKIPLNQQEDLMVWMRTSALPNFRKLYGKIEVDLEKGDKIDVVLQNNYNTYSFNGQKKLVLSTTSWLGGKNDFLGIASLVVGGLCFFLAIAYTTLYYVMSKYKNKNRP